MNIGIFSYYYLPVINGVTLTIADWKRRSKKHGTHVSIFVPRLDHGEKPDADVVPYPAVSLYKKFGITVPFFPEFTLEKLVRAKRFDLLHVHHPYYIGNLALLIKKRLGIPLVFTYHTRYADYVTSYFPVVSGTFIHLLITNLLVRFMNQCDAVTVANIALKEELLKSGVNVPVWIVPPGVNTRKLSLGHRDQTRKRLGIPPHAKVLVYVGRLATEKNIFFLVRAFFVLSRKYPDLLLLLCGNGLEERRIRSFVVKKKLRHRVIFATTETPETIPDIYAASDMFIHASQTETYGRVVVEAMAAGLPIVALKGPSVIDLLLDGISGRIIYKKSVHQFANGVAALIEDVPLGQRLGKNAQKEARQKYDSAVSWSALNQVYETIRTMR